MSERHLVRLSLHLKDGLFATWKRVSRFYPPRANNCLLEINGWHQHEWPTQISKGKQTKWHAYRAEFLALLLRPLGLALVAISMVESPR